MKVFSVFVVLACLLFQPSTSNAQGGSAGGSSGGGHAIVNPNESPSWTYPQARCGGSNPCPSRGPEYTGCAEGAISTLTMYAGRNIGQRAEAITERVVCE